MTRRPTFMKSNWLVLCAALTMAAGAFAATPAEDAAQANALFMQNKLDAALPIYERLAAAEPANTLYAERLALGLYSLMETTPAGKEREALIIRALREVERALSIGNRSPQLQQILARLRSDDVHKLNPEQEQLRLAEAAFAKGDLETALAGYKAVAAANPRSYAAHLYAGDVYFVKGDATSAGEWFSKAVAINPDIETAYRYWGDVLDKSGNDRSALDYYIRAVVAEPYNATARASLEAWAKRNGTKLQAPQLPRPAVVLKDDGSGKGSQPTITLDPGLMSDKLAGAAWVAYTIHRTLWMQGKFLERNPGATAYRHSMAEEVESLRFAVELMLKDLEAARQVPALRDLIRLYEDGMLEPYVLLVGVDAGIAQDYPAWRNAHREQLFAFIEKYIVARVGTSR